MERLATTYDADFDVVCNNADPGDTNEAYVKPWFENTSHVGGAYNHIKNFYVNVDTPFWYKIWPAWPGGIPMHYLIDKDKNVRETFYGGHGANADAFYDDYVCDLLGLPAP